MRSRDVLHKCEKCGNPSQGRWCQKCFRGGEHTTKPNEQTDAELDAIIEEQMKNRPAWWDKESGK